MFSVPKFISGLSIGTLLCGFTCLCFYELKKKNNKISISFKNIKYYIETMGRYFLDFWVGEVLIILFLVIAFWAFWYDWELNNTILAFTGWAILLYTWKTWQLKDLTSAQLSYNIRPLIVLTGIKKNKNFSYNSQDVTIVDGIVCVETEVIANIQNIGEGLAVNIKIEQIKVYGEKDGNIAYVYAEELQGLRKGETKELIFLKDTSISTAYLEEKLLDGKSDDKIIKIKYNDLEGKRFYTLMKRKELGGRWVFSETGTIS